MALITVHAVVDVALNPRMVGIGLCSRMARAVGAREDRVIVRIRMAGCTNSASVAMVDAPPRMAECCSGPRSSGVAGRAIGRENRRCRAVDWVGRGVVIRRVASVTRCRQRRVVAVHMAVGARHGRMGPGQRKRRCAVIELAVRPQNRVVAQLACCRKSGLDMVHRSSCRVVIIQVAGDTSRVGAGQIVVVVDVAVGAYAGGNSVRVR